MFPRMSKGQDAETQLSIKEDWALPGCANSPSLLPMPLPPHSGGFPHAVAVLSPLLGSGAGAGINEAGPFFRGSGPVPWKRVAGGVQALGSPTMEGEDKQRMHSLVKSLTWSCLDLLLRFPMEVML